MERPVLTRDTMVPAGLVLAFLAWAVSYGIMVQKVDDTRSQLSEVKQNVQTLSDKMDRYIFGAKTLSGK